MTNAVSLAYITSSEERPTLLEQFAACREYAAAHSYTIVGEYNEIDEADHQASGAAFEATAKAIAEYGATVVLVYQPGSAVLNQLDGLNATIEKVTTLPASLAGTDSL